MFIVPFSLPLYSPSPSLSPAPSSSLSLSDHNGELDWKTLGNMLSAHILGEVWISASCDMHTCVCMCVYRATSLSSHASLVSLSSQASLCCNIMVVGD